MTHLVGILCGDKIWKRVFSYALLFIVISTFFLSSFVSVFAQNVPPQIQNGSNINYGPTTGGPYSGPGPVPNGTGGAGGVNGGPGTGGQGTGAPQPGGAVGDGGVTQEPVPVNPLVEVGEIDDPILRLMHAVFVEGLGWVLGIFGMFFDFAVENFIIGFGDKYINSNLGNTIDSLWGTVRDIFNLTFIFGLVYIGFKMILDSSDSSARKMLVYLVGAALLVNFSLFITKFIVDLANITAFQVYRAFSGPAEVTGFSLTTTFKDLMGVNDILSVQYNVDFWTGFRYVFGLAIVFLVMAYVFLAGAVMITIRFVVLCIYMVFSPIMFLGWVFPGMQGQSARYWKGFLGQAFFAPAFLFMLYLSYRVAQSYNTDVRSLQHLFNSGSITETDKTPETIAYFALVMVFLVASLMVARHMGAVGANSTISMGNKLWKGSARGLGGIGGKYTRNKLDSWATNENAPIRRSVGRAATLLGARDYADKAYKNSPQGSWAETRKKRSVELATRNSDASVKAEIKRHAATGGAALETAIRGASTGQIIKVLRDYKVNTPEYNNIVDSLTYEQRKKILDSKDEDFNDTEKSNVGGRTNQRIKSQITGATGSLDPISVSKLTPKEIDILGNAWIYDNLHMLTNSQVEKLASDSTVLAEGQKSTLKKAWGDDLVGRLGAGFNFKDYMDGKTAKDVAALPAAILTDAGAVPYLTDKVLREVAVSNMATRDREKIDANVVHLSGPGASYFSSTNNHYKTNW